MFGVFPRRIGFTGNIHGSASDAGQESNAVFFPWPGFYDDVFFLLRNDAKPVQQTRQFRAVHGRLGAGLCRFVYGSGPVLFDVTDEDGETVTGVAAAGKNCLFYMWDRSCTSFRDSKQRRLYL